MEVDEVTETVKEVKGGLEEEEEDEDSDVESVYGKKVPSNGV